jgi:hypothetical protein
MLKVPDARLDIIVMTNRADVFSVLLANKILDACLPDLDPVRIPSTAPLSTGIFRSLQSGRVIQLQEIAGQQIASIDGLDVPMEPDAEGALWPTGIWGTEKRGLTRRGDLARPTSIRLNDFGNVDDFARLEPVAAPAIEAIAGQYRSATTHTEATVFNAMDGPRLRTVGRFGSAEFALECLAEGIWRAKLLGSMPWGGILSFSSDASSFNFDTFRTRALTFQRRTARRGRQLAGSGAGGASEKNINEARVRRM